MKYSGFIFIFLFGCSFLCKAQEDSKIIVHKDTMISLLQQFRAENELNPTQLQKIKLFSANTPNKKDGKRVKTKGFRVQIYTGPSRNDAYATQTNFKSKYKTIESYINYDEPNYRVKVGDFRSRNEANNMMRVLRSQYQSVFVSVEDIWVYE